MKYNFFFIHGWGFDKDFWRPVGKLINSEVFCDSVKYIDLGFFGNKNTDLTFNKKGKNIFVIHSFGLNWFLKNKINFFALFNFFSAPNFLKYQREHNLKKKILKSMISKFNKFPCEVLNDFYVNCGLDENFKIPLKKNIPLLIDSLNDLLQDNLEDKFFDINFKLFSFYSFNDKVFDPSMKKIFNLKNINHNIVFFKKQNHAFPFTNPEETFKIISYKVKKLISYND